MKPSWPVRVVYSSICSIAGFLGSFQRVISITRAFAAKRCLLLICILKEILKNLDVFSFFAYFNKRSYADRLLSKLNNVVRPIHVHKNFFILKLNILIKHDVVDKWLLTSAEVTTKHQELSFVVIV